MVLKTHARKLKVSGLVIVWIAAGVAAGGQPRKLARPTRLELTNTEKAAHKASAEASDMRAHQVRIRRGSEGSSTCLWNALAALFMSINFISFSGKSLACPCSLAPLRTS